MHRTGARNIKLTFSAGQLTHFGGVYLLHCFLQRLQVRTYLSMRLRIVERNNHFSVTERLCAILYPMILGISGSELASLLGTNGVFQYITGLPRFPHPDTLRQFLVHKAPLLLPRLHAAHHLLRTHFLAVPHSLSRYWFDFDSTVRTLYGNQEGVSKGYNPIHPGKKSYHPLVCTEAHLRDCVEGELRYGDVHTAAGAVPMLKRMRAMVPAGTQEMRVRADAGFYGHEFIEELAENRMKFAVVARLTGPLKLRVPGLRYQKVNATESTAEFRYQPHGWKQPCRFVTLREKLTEHRQEQLSLFTMDRYAYHVIVTNLPLTPWGVFSFYQPRAGLERIIRILKDDYPFAKAPTHSFAANTLYAELSLLAYNIIIWFKRLCLPEDWQSYTIGTLRHRLLLIPGNFTRTGNRPELRLPRNTPYQDTIEYAMDRIKKLSPLV